MVGLIARETLIVLIVFMLLTEKYVGLGESEIYW
jgi:hypothetical protein